MTDEPQFDSSQFYCTCGAQLPAVDGVCPECGVRWSVGAGGMWRTEGADRHSGFVCDVTDCTRPAGWAYIGEGGEFYLCEDHHPPPRVRSYDRDGVPHDDVLRTKTGSIVTEDDIARWAEEAAEGHPDA